MILACFNIGVFPLPFKLAVVALAPVPVPFALTSNDDDDARIRWMKASHERCSFIGMRHPYVTLLLACLLDERKEWDTGWCITAYIIVWRFKTVLEICQNRATNWAIPCVIQRKLWLVVSVSCYLKNGDVKGYPQHRWRSSSCPWCKSSRFTWVLQCSTRF